MEGGPHRNPRPESKALVSDLALRSAADENRRSTPLPGTSRQCRRGDLYHNPTLVGSGGGHDDYAGLLCGCRGRTAGSSRSPTATLMNTPSVSTPHLTDHYPAPRSGTTRGLDLQSIGPDDRLVLAGSPTASSTSPRMRGSRRTSDPAITSVGSRDAHRDRQHPHPSGTPRSCARAESRARLPFAAGARMPAALRSPRR